MIAKKHYTITTPDGRRWRRYMTEEEVKEWSAKGYEFAEVVKDEVVPNRSDLRRKGLRAQRMGRGTNRRSSGTPTGRGAIFRTMEQHFRPEGQTRGQKIVRRFER